MPKIYLYAEVLTNIRQISLYASLETEKNEDTEIEISSDKKVVTVRHDGESSSIYLPTQISGTAKVIISGEKRKEMSLRLELEDTSDSRFMTEDAIGVEFPWPSDDLTPATSIRCKSCKVILLPQGHVTTWKDLPSESWADMMDFWYCHEPVEGSVPEQVNDPNAKEDGLASQPAATKNTSLVDAVSFLLHPEDCINVKLALPGLSAHDHAPLYCSHCSYFIGFVQNRKQGQVIQKSRVDLQPSTTSSWESYPASTFICTQILSLIESRSTRKIILRTVPPRIDSRDSEPQPALLLWVFNPNIHYSSSRLGPTAHRAMKIFYQITTNHPSSGTSAVDMSHYEELLIHDPLQLLEFTAAIQESTTLLPLSARMYQEWAVGILDRYERCPSGQRALDNNMLAKKFERTEEGEGRGRKGPELAHMPELPGMHALFE